MALTVLTLVQILCSFLGHFEKHRFVQVWVPGWVSQGLDL